MIGNYSGDLTLNMSPNNYYGVNYTLGTIIRVSHTIQLRSLYANFYTGGQFYGRAVVYDANANLLASSAYGNGMYPSTSTPQQFELLNGGIIMVPNTDYTVGFYNGSSGDGSVGIRGTVQAAPYSYSTTKSGVTITRQNQGMAYTNTEGYPYSNTGSYQVSMGLTFTDPNTLPTAPTSIVVSNSPVPTGQPAQVSWTHNDADGNPQSKYQIRWRKKD